MNNSIEVRRRTAQSAPVFPADMPSILQRIYANRGIGHIDELDLSVKGLLHFNQLTDCEKAAERIGQAILAGESICICGDFDADGATSVALLMSFFRTINHAKAFYLVPNRFSDGYGLSPTLAQYAHDEGANLLITVDNGISSHAGVSKANALDMQVIITDHHLPSAELPHAYAIVNPNRRDCAFPSKQLAGVGVAFYLLLALRAWFKAQHPNHAVASLKIAEYLDLVALGTVADVVPLDYNNRILVRQGLARIREGVCRPGITSLLAVAGRDASKITALDLGFSVAPRINAAGRLDDIQQGIECLLAQDSPSAQIVALRLDELNQQRRKIETTMQEEAQACLARLKVDETELPSVLTVYDQHFHQGVIGIVAGRLKEQFYRPVMVFAEAEDGTLKGSCRSVMGVHIRDLLEQVASEFPGVISKFGGHAMAAGLSVPKAQWAEFNAAVQQVAKRWVDSDALARVIWSDGELEPHEFNLDIAGALQHAGPWGQSFPQPMFDGQFRIIQERWLKDVHLKLVVQPIGSTQTFDAIAFNVPRANWQWNSPAEANLVFKLDVNEFRGQRNVQLLIEHVEA